MNYKRLGNSGMQVSRICLGMMTYGDPAKRPWSLPLEEADPFVKRAIEAGINFFDTANAYSAGDSEIITGKLLEKYAKREDYVLASKVFFSVGGKPNGQGLSRKHIFQAVHDSLKRLEMDYIDLYQIHRFDPNTPVEETMEALNDLVRAGLVRYIGASSMYAWQFAKMQNVAERNGWTKFVSMQNHYNLIYREEEREMIPLLTDSGTGMIPWSPLARGTLTGNRTREGEKLSKRAETDAFAETLYSERDFDIVDRVSEIAIARGVSNAQVALAWMLEKPYITAPIIGASKMQHLEDAIAALELKLSPEEVVKLEELYQPHKISGHA
jgi:aryl-alcohol dehydrogenase-like predicted oxidoreductase